VGGLRNSLQNFNGHLKLSLGHQDLEADSYRELSTRAFTHLGRQGSGEIQKKKRGWQDVKKKKKSRKKPSPRRTIAVTEGRLKSGQRSVKEKSYDKEGAMGFFGG